MIVFLRPQGDIQSFALNVGRDSISCHSTAKLTGGNGALCYALFIELHHSQSGSFGYSEKFNFEVKKLNSPRLPIMYGNNLLESINTRSDSKATNDAEIPANGDKFPIFLFSLCSFLVLVKSIGTSFSSPN
jgi:hypothetical protein